MTKVEQDCRDCFSKNHLIVEIALVKITLFSKSQLLWLKYFYLSNFLGVSRRYYAKM